MSKYLNQVPNPSYKKQVFYNAKRRLLQFGQSTQEIQLGINPPLVSLVLTTLIIVVRNCYPDGSSTWLHDYWLPVISIFSFVVSSGIFVATTVTDRELKLRNLLKLAGMRSSAYYFGIWLGDTLIFIVPASLLILVAWAFDFEGVSEIAGWLILDLIIFSFPFLWLNYLVGSLFRKASTAIKY